MSKDVLDRAAAIVRDRYDGTSENATRTEHRVLLAVRAHARHRNRVPLVALPMVAAMLASAAWGSMAETSRASVRSAIAGFFTAHKATPPAKPRPVVAGAHIVASAPSASVVLGDPPRPDPAPNAPRPVLAPALPRRSSPKAAAPVAQGQSAVSQGASEAEISALYRAAHHAQFSGGDPAAAVQLWDRYLAAAPNGSLSPEARYNRAIALARLGRNAEAASALDPFARGDYGSYRQNEAKALLEALRPPATP